jgi:hypothetical protein
MAVNRQGFRGAVIEYEHDVRQQAMTAGQIHHPPAPVAPAHAAGDFPGFVKFFGRKRSGAANSPGNPIEQGVAGIGVNLVGGKPALG